MGKQWKLWETFIFLGSKITADGECSHEIKRHMFLGRKAMTNLDSVLKSRATHSSVLAWRIPRMGEPCGLLSMGSHRVAHDWSDLAAAAAAVIETRIQVLRNKEEVKVLTDVVWTVLWRQWRCGWAKTMEGLRMHAKQRAVDKWRVN